MKKYITAPQAPNADAILLDDMILTTEQPTTAGSKMLEGYMSLFEAEAVSRLKAAGFALGGKANVGEFGLDLLGETSYFGACTDEAGNLVSGAAAALAAGEAATALTVDVNGAPRRAAALAGLTYLKPSYGTVSRFGIIPGASSGETVGIMAKSAEKCRAVLAAVAGHDDKDGTSLPEAVCAKAQESAPIKKIAVAKSMLEAIDAETAKNVEAFKAAAAAAGIELVEVDTALLHTAQVAWNIIMSAEVCNNVSRYDGVKFGYRTADYTDIDSLYTNSRTEAFGTLLKSTILFGSDTLSDENYTKVFDKALRIRRVICNYFDTLFADCDALLLPACSKAAYQAADRYTVYAESLYTAPASISGLPALILGGVQLIGSRYSDGSLLALAEKLQKEGN